MKKIKFTLQLPRKHKVVFIEEQSENKLLFEFIGDFPIGEKEDKILSYEQTLKEIYQMLKNGFEIMTD